MAHTPDLDQLMADLEQGPSRELDMRVGMACSPWPCEPFKSNPVMGRYGYSEIGKRGPDDRHGVIAPRYTSSLDAALTLVPVGYNWTVDGFPDDGACATCYRLGVGSDIYDGSTPALALCIAALRARAAIALATGEQK